MLLSRVSLSQRGSDSYFNALSAWAIHHTDTHTCTLVPQVRADRCRHALVTTEPGKQKWWNADSRGKRTHTHSHTQIPTRYWLRNASRPWVQLQPRIDFQKEMAKWEEKSIRPSRKWLVGEAIWPLKTICSDWFSSIHSLSRVSGRIQALHAACGDGSFHCELLDCALWLILRGHNIEQWSN